MSDTRITSPAAYSPWHRESYDKFITESLPKLLAERLPLTDYSVTPIDTDTCRVTVAIDSISVDYAVIQPDESGIFEGNKVVVPVASSEKLDVAEIKCVGEQMHDHIAERLGKATSGLPWDEQLVRAWLPLDTWMREVVTSGMQETYDRWATGQWLDRTNGLAVITHLRRIIIPDAQEVIHQSQFGRVCPFETPEGPNIGRVFSLAMGATIRDGRIEIVDDRPEAALGLTASAVPFLEHNDANRQLLGVNMMRQWLIPADPEPAYVQTGSEPDIAMLWCGRNLLTAFISYGPETYEDAILVSESAAKRLSYPDQVNVGDKLSNRHGTKGVIGQILPDEKMPHLADGTPVELVYSSIALHTRLNFGQIREAVMGRIARAKGEPVIVRPFHAPTDDELKTMLREAGLPESGMETLTVDGKPLEMPSTAGYVYWGRTVHTSASKVHAAVRGDGTNRQGELEYYTLRDIGCYETIRSHFNTCSDDRRDKDEFVVALESGPVEQAGAPSPKFTELRKRLASMGIAADLTDSGIHFHLASPPEHKGVLALAEPIEHPWLPGHVVTEIGLTKTAPDLERVIEANKALSRLIESGAPESLRQKAREDLRTAISAQFGALIAPDDRQPTDFAWGMAPLLPQLRFGNRIMFSGRSVLAPDGDLRLDQLGLAEEIAWTIFAPLVVREIGDRSEVEQRTDRAARALDEIMARSWVIMNTSPTLIPTALMAFHPLCIPEPVIRIHPLICFLMNADFDGDQAAVFLPIAEAAQREAGEKLSLAGHLRRDPNLYDLTLLRNEALWGLAKLSLDPAGVERISETAGVQVALSGGMVDRDTTAAALREALRTSGPEAMIEALQRLFDLGMQVMKGSGASLSPFVGSELGLPPVPETDGEAEWAAHVDAAKDILQSRMDYTGDFGAQLLAVKSNARGSFGGRTNGLRLLTSTGPVRDASGKPVAIRHDLQEGLTPEEAFACVAGARQGLADIHTDLTRSAYGVRASGGPKGFGVLARAMRAAQPGPVFARAAAAGEVDPLTDLDSRLFVGLAPE